MTSDDTSSSEKVTLELRFKFVRQISEPTRLIQPQPKRSKSPLPPLKIKMARTLLATNCEKEDSGVEQDDYSSRPHQHLAFLKKILKVRQERREVAVASLVEKKLMEPASHSTPMSLSQLLAKLAHSSFLDNLIRMLSIIPLSECENLNIVPVLWLTGDKLLQHCLQTHLREWRLPILIESPKSQWMFAPFFLARFTQLREFHFTLETYSGSRVLDIAKQVLENLPPTVETLKLHLQYNNEIVGIVPPHTIFDALLQKKPTLFANLQTLEISSYDFIDGTLRFNSKTMPNLQSLVYLPSSKILWRSNILSLRDGLLSDNKTNVRWFDSNSLLIRLDIPFVTLWLEETKFLPRTLQNLSVYAMATQDWINPCWPENLDTMSMECVLCGPQQIQKLPRSLTTLSVSSITQSTFKNSKEFWPPRLHTIHSSISTGFTVSPSYSSDPYTVQDFPSSLTCLENVSLNVPSSFIDTTLCLQPLSASCSLKKIEFYSAFNDTLGKILNMCPFVEHLTEHYTMFQRCSFRLNSSIFDQFASDSHNLVLKRRNLSPNVKHYRLKCYFKCSFEDSVNSYMIHHQQSKPLEIFEFVVRVENFKTTHLLTNENLMVAPSLKDSLPKLICKCII